MATRKSEASSRKGEIPDIPKNVSAIKRVITGINEIVAEVYEIFLSASLWISAMIASLILLPLNKLRWRPMNEMKFKKVVKEAIRAKSENATNKYQSAVGSKGILESLSPPISAMVASPIPCPLEELRQRTNFCAKAVTDQRAPWIWDIQLLPGGRVLVVDSETNCIKLFDTQGHQQETLMSRDSPYRLAVLDRSNESSCQNVAVTLPDCLGIDILEIRGYKMRVKRSLHTSRGYYAVAAVTKQTLAVGYFYLAGPGIDLIDIDGQVLRQICSSVAPIYMEITEHGDLICSTRRNKIARVNVHSGTLVFHKSVPHIRYPWGFAILSDGSILVANKSSKTLNLVSSQGTFTAQLWAGLIDTEQEGQLWSVSTYGSVCACATEYGSVYIFDCLY